MHIFLISTRETGKKPMEAVNQIFTPGSGTAMLFTQANFWIFFGVVLFGFSIIYKQISLRNGFLFAASLFFYYTVGSLFILFLSGIIAINFFLAQLSGRISARKGRKGILAFSLVTDLGLLVYLKYISFLISLLNSMFGASLDPTAFLIKGINLTGTSVTEFIVPIGISFFTFQLLSYSVEVYRRKIEPIKNFVDFGFYISFFPNLISGPIVRPQEFIPQIRKEFSLNREEFGSATFLLLSGLVKKIVFADYLSVNLIGRVFENPHLFSGFENLLAVYGYTLQIYFDFSGYTDIAVGTALLLGFRLPPNFNAPYRARNISEFWRRWHMSLTTWFRDYLFLPLAYLLSGRMKRRSYLGIRSEKWIYLFSIMVTFLLCGLWHGAAMNFVIWGGLHGIALALHKFVFPKVRMGKKSREFRNFLSGFVTFNFVVFTWIIFRSQDLSSVSIMIRKILFSFHGEIILQVVLSYWKIILVLLSGYFLVWFPEIIKNKIRDQFIKSPQPVLILTALIIIIFVYQFKVAGIQPFIYFSF
jgi:alginate O-acetyltransferase complex protein AlgI